MDAVLQEYEARRDEITTESFATIYAGPWLRSTDMARSDCAAVCRRPTAVSSSLIRDCTPILTRLNPAVSETPEDVIERMYSSLCSLTRQAGMNHYEISNFCKDGMHSRHNSSYWISAFDISHALSGMRK